MNSLSINKQVLRLALPSILANITVPLVGIVDLAIAGHLGDAATISGVAVGTMLFDFLYWNFGFLRAGTGGITAQAYGRKDFKAAINTFLQGISTSLVAALLILVIQWVYVKLAFMVVDCSAEARELAEKYFFIRIWAAPATLSLMVFRGWFIGMQNTVLSMVLDIFVNVVNAALAYLFAVPMGLGVAGVAYGTLTAQYSGLFLAIILLTVNFKQYFHLMNFSESLVWKNISGFFKLNGSLFIRSIMMLVVYVGFTIIASRYGDTKLAVSNIMMKLLLLYSYALDGFAYAAEALCGKYIGAKEKGNLLITIKIVFIWTGVLGVVSTALYGIAGDFFCRIFTNDAQVLAAFEPYMFWLLLMPILSCIAFTWDGIFIGATASAALRNCMFLAAPAFVLVYFCFESILSIQALYLAYFAHLLVRSVYMTLVWKRNVLQWENAIS